MLTSTTPFCRFSLLASRQQRRALEHLFGASLLLGASAASIGILLSL